MRIFALLLALALTYGIFLGLSEVHIEKINIETRNNPAPRFFRIYKPQLIKPKPKSPPPKPKPKETGAKKVETKPLESEEHPKKIVGITNLDQTPVIVYPDIARKAGVECKLLVEMIINKKGRVEHAKVIHTTQTGYGFEQNAVDAVQRLRFQPILQNGNPIPVKIIYPIDFMLVE